MDEQARAIGERVRYWRQRRNLDRKRFADMVGRSTSWLDKKKASAISCGSRCSNGSPRRSTSIPRSSPTNPPPTGPPGASTLRRSGQYGQLSEATQG
jgi:hypothetical protein